jgi:hypothetical protein
MGNSNLLIFVFEIMSNKRPGNGGPTNSQNSNGSKKNRVDNSQPSFEDELMMMEEIIDESIDVDTPESQELRWQRPSFNIDSMTENLGNKLSLMKLFEIY